jgi:hypothetical protein
MEMDGIIDKDNEMVEKCDTSVHDPSVAMESKSVITRMKQRLCYLSLEK